MEAGGSEWQEDDGSRPGREALLREGILGQKNFGTRSGKKFEVG